MRARQLRAQEIGVPGYREPRLEAIAGATYIPPEVLDGRPVDPRRAGAVHLDPAEVGQRSVVQIDGRRLHS